MWTREETQARLQKESLGGECWGRSGIEATQALEESLKVRFGPALREFAIRLGNLRVDPFSILILGDEKGFHNAASETRTLRECYPDDVGAGIVKIMDHAGEVYLYYPEDDRVSAFDSKRPFKGEETLKWKTFTDFAEWVITEAKAINHV